MMCAT